MTINSLGFFLIGIALIVLPSSEKTFRNKNPVVNKKVPENITLSEIIITTNFLCTTIASALKAGFSPMKAYEISSEIVDSPELKLLSHKLLLPDSSLIFPAYEDQIIPSSRNFDDIMKNLSPNNHHETSGVLRNISAQLHNLYELAILRGTALQSSILTTAARLEEEQLARSLEKTEQAGVKLGGPLAAGFLPAFIAIGLLPIIIGIAQIFFTDIGIQT